MSEINTSPQIGGLIGQLIFVSVTGFIIFIIGFLSEQYLAAIFGLSIVVLFIVPYPIYLRKTEYKIMDDKIVRKRDTLSEEYEEVPFDKIQNTQLKRGYIQKRMGGFGNISLSTAGSSSSELKLMAVKNSEKLHNIISKRCDSKSKTIKNNDKSNSKMKMYKESKKLSRTSKVLNDIINNGDRL